MSYKRMEREICSDMHSKRQMKSNRVHGLTELGGSIRSISVGQAIAVLLAKCSIAKIKV